MDKNYIAGYIVEVEAWFKGRSCRSQRWRKGNTVDIFFHCISNNIKRVRFRTDFFSLILADNNCKFD